MLRVWPSQLLTTQFPKRKQASFALGSESSLDARPGHPLPSSPTDHSRLGGPALNPGLVCCSRHPGTSSVPGNKRVRDLIQNTSRAPGILGGPLWLSGGPPRPHRGRAARVGCSVVPGAGGKPGRHQERKRMLEGSTFWPNETHSPQWVIKSPLDLSWGEGTGTLCL